MKIFANGTWMTLVFAIVTAWFLWESLALNSAASLIPRFVVPLTLLLLGIQLALELNPRGRRKEHPAERPDQRTNAPVARGGATSPWVTMLWIAALPATIGLLGLTAGAAVYCLLFLKWRSKESWTLSFAISLVVGLLLHLLFSVLLQSSIQVGLVSV